MLHPCGDGGTERGHDLPKDTQRDRSEPSYALPLQLQGKSKVEAWARGSHLVPAPQERYSCHLWCSGGGVISSVLQTQRERLLPTLQVGGAQKSCFSPC